MGPGSQVLRELKLYSIATDYCLQGFNRQAVNIGPGAVYNIPNWMVTSSQSESRSHGPNLMG